MKSLTPAERLIVAADFRPEGSETRRDVLARMMSLINALEGMGVIIKVNSILRALGYDLIDTLHGMGLKVFADLKLNDIDNTLKTDGAFLFQSQPELLTVMCSTGVRAMQALVKQLPGTEVLGVTVLTTLTDADSQAMFACDTEEAALRFARMAGEAGLGGLISSSKELEVLRANIEVEMTFNTPAIRPVWSVVEGDDQNPERILTPKRAIEAGATRLVIGRPITRAEKPREAVLLTLDEIAAATQ